MSRVSDCKTCQLLDQDIETLREENGKLKEKLKMWQCGAEKMAHRIAKYDNCRAAAHDCDDYDSIASVLRRNGIKGKHRKELNYTVDWHSG
jgi:hypothetical protein